MARITLIEDEDDLGSLIACFLSGKGHHVRHTRDARTGVALCEDGSTDVVITDLNVYNSEALEELVRPAAPNGRPPIIVISGALDSPAQSERACRLAGSNVLAKPFRMTDLMRVLESLLPAVCRPAVQGALT